MGKGLKKPVEQTGDNRYNRFIKTHYKPVLPREDFTGTKGH